MIKDCATFDWHEISPTIFGAVFESTLNPETRRTGGMHYTSIENIHKVIDPLFMDELEAEFESSLADLYDETFMPSELRKAHQSNDRAVMEAYGFAKDMTETEIVAELFKMYEKLTKESK